MTEEEAKTKWCPFVRAQLWQPATEAVDNPPINRTTWSNSCIGSACMAWRFDGVQRKWLVTRGGKTESYFWNPAAFAGYEDAEITEQPKEAHGFCGLAGKP